MSQWLTMMPKIFLKRLVSSTVVSFDGQKARPGAPLDPVIGMTYVKDPPYVQND